MGQESIYREIFDGNIARIEAGEIAVDEHLKYPESDSRLGLSLVIGIDFGLRRRYEEIVTSFRALDPDQYYYPFDDLHITIFDFIRCREGLRREDLETAAFEDLVGLVLKDESSFDIGFRGLVFSAAAGLLTGYDQERLAGVRERLRARMAARGIVNDERYESETAHVTFCRFCQELRDPSAFVGHIRAARNACLGGMGVKRADLVIHDWYNRKETREVVASFPL